MSDTTTSFGAVALEWLEHKRPSVKQSTYCTYLIIVRAHLIPFFAPLAGVSEADARQFVAMKSESGLGRKTVHGMLAVLRAIIRYAARSAGVPVPEWEIALPAPARRPGPAVLAPDDHRRLLRHLADNPSPMTIGVMLSLCTGMRIGEVCALRWSDISLRRRVITVARTASRVYDIDARHTERILSTPKTDSSAREIPIAAGLYNALRAVRRMSRGTYVLGAGLRAADPRSYREYFARMLRHLGIPHIAFHGLRHTFATRCIESRCDCKTVSVILGHSAVSTTLNLYVHPGIEQKKRCIDRMSRALGKL